MSLPSVQLKPGRESSLLRRHPWVFSGAIDRITGNPAAGDWVRVTDHRGALLGLGGYSPDSQIRVRMLRFDEGPLDDDFLAQRIATAVAKRPAFDPAQPNAARLVYGESDGLPGLIVDRYADVLICQFLFTAMDTRKSALVSQLQAQTGCRSVYERSDVPVRRKEGLQPVSGLLAGDPPPPRVTIEEHGVAFDVDVVHGQKTGFYLDQATNRLAIQAYCPGRTVLNGFSYTGAFSVAALRGGAAHVTSLDSSKAALAAAEGHVARNGYAPSVHSILEGDAFDTLRDLQRQQRRFDLIILDPPKLADAQGQVPKAARAYKDLALQAARLLVDGGTLVSFSCSGAIDLALLQKITADAVLDAGRSGAVIQYLHQAADHPVALPFPESQYLKGLICRIND